jgi:1-hydroxycarotenoid 3,4-desaturase
VIGAGIGGLSAALALAVRGVDVVVYEKAAAPGGKMRAVKIGDARIDAGPTVFTMRDVFELIFDEAGAVLGEQLDVAPLEILARHAWDADSRLDLFADRQRSAQAISEFASAGEGRRYLDFCRQAGKTFKTLDDTFIRTQRPNPLSLTQRTLAEGLGGIRNIKPFGTLWGKLQSQFRDPRLRQLFGRYATYCGSSPFQAPATLMLVAHVEQEGVWVLRNGMQELALAMTRLAQNLGVTFHFEREISAIELRHGSVAAVRDATGGTQPCRAVISNADPAALARGLFGRHASRAVNGYDKAPRSLSAMTFSLCATARGFPLLHHNVFFSRDYQREFDDIFGRRQLPTEPTVYVCAQDRHTPGDAHPGKERLFCLTNAPAIGDSHHFDDREIAACMKTTWETLGRCGLQLDAERTETVVTSPSDFNRLFPASGGALYGQASHGWRASFTRPAARTRIAGLYLAGGATHPGPGIPMAAMSGRLAVQSLLADQRSIAQSSRVAMRGGTSMR